MASSKRLQWLTIGVGVFTAALIILLFSMSWPVPRTQFLIICTLTLFLLVVGLWSIHRYTIRHFIEPDLAFRMWLQQVCDGELDATIGLDESHQHYKELNFHTRNLASSLRRLSDDMDSLVESQTRKLSDQKTVMELLFKLTADVSSETEDEAAFGTVCDYLAEWFQSTRVSCYRVVNNQQELRCVATRRADRAGSSSVVAKPDDTLITAAIKRDSIPHTISRVAVASAGSATSAQHWVPFFCGERREGVLIIDRNDSETSEHIETKRVLSTVSEQLSLLCGQQLVQEQMLQARLSRDRNELAAEIHDSLAQTLLALRYQTTLLSEKLKSQGDEKTYQDMLKIGGSIEEANEEVRGLIREYRNPLSEHRYADSLQEVIDEFSQSSGITVFFQSDDPQIRFTPREESTLQRIIAEALNNTRKYAKASMIRVYLQQEPSGMRRILVEDDGIGFDQKTSAVPSVAPDTPPDKTNASSGGVNDNAEHIGLTIMRERAWSIGAKMSIDSEVGEGTRLSITMPPMIETSRESA